MKRGVPMRVPSEFQHYVREQAGKKNKSMFKYLQDLVREGNRLCDEKPKNDNWFKW